MKNLALIFIAMSITVMGFAQEELSDLNSESKKEIVYDTSTIELKKSKILIITPEDGDTLSVGDTVSEPYGFAGVILGVNGYLSSSNSFDLGKENTFMELDYAQSRFVQVNLLEQEFHIVEDYVKAYIGLGMEFNNYRLRNNYRFIAEDSLSAFKDTITDYTKIKMTTTFVNVPLLFEFNTHKDWNKSFHFGVGAYAGLRVASSMKYVYEENSRKHKDKVKDDFYLNSFRYGLMAKVGYGRFNIFASYALNSLFEDGKGPEVYPFNVGLTLVGF